MKVSRYQAGNGLCETVLGDGGLNGKLTAPTSSATDTSGEKEKVKPQFQSFSLICAAFCSFSSPVAVLLSIYECLFVQTLIMSHFLFNLLTLHKLHFSL